MTSVAYLTRAVGVRGVADSRHRQERSDAVIRSRRNAAFQAFANIATPDRFARRDGWEPEATTINRDQRRNSRRSCPMTAGIVAV